MLGIAALLYAILQWALLPREVIAFNDDFGYLRSVVLTVQHGRPWTDDWLEPWNASFATLSAVAWRITGNFRLATQGVQIALLAIGFIAAAILLRRRGLNRWAATGIAGVIFTTPTLLAKNLEYTGFVLSTSCLLFALVAAESKRWGWFTLIACTALATRQSALAWFAIPAAECVRSLITDRRLVAPAIGPFIACASGAAVYGLCSWLMNRTHAQAVMTSHMWDSLNATTILRSSGAALMVALAAIGFGNLAVLSCAQHRTWRMRPSPTAIVAQVFGAGVLVVLLIAAKRLDIQVEHGLFSTGFGHHYLAIAALVSLVGWFAAPLALSRPATVGCLGAVAIVSIRGAVWDYYLADAALFAFFAAGPTRGAASAASAPAGLSAWPRRLAVAVLIAAVLTVHIPFVNSLKASMDTNRALVVLLERSLEEKKIAPSDLSIAPFGFIGWHLYPYFIDHDGRNGAYIADFQRYLDRGALTYETRGWDDPRPMENPATIIASDIFPIGWRDKNRFTLRRAAITEPATLTLDRGAYRFDAFPLSNAGWQNHLAPAQSVRTGQN